MEKPRKFNSLEDWRKAEGEPMEQKKCRECGRPIDARFELCRDCQQKRQAGADPGSNRIRSELPEGYLQHGYFNAAGHLLDTLITTEALAIAKAFERIRLTSGQLRRFYAHARLAERRLENGEIFAAVRPAILAMQPMAWDAVGRAKGSGAGDYELFKQFIDRHVELAAETEKNFREGFLKHFMYIVAYFTYLKPNERAR